MKKAVSIVTVVILIALVSTLVCIFIVPTLQTADPVAHSEPLYDSDTASIADQPETQLNATDALAGLTPEQRNSINMLNHLVVFSQEISASEHSRLFLEDAYANLINNTDPSTVDPRTQQEISYLFDTINSYRLIDAKRERLEYIYEQEKAQTIRNAIPNPLGLLTASVSDNLIQIATSVSYMIADAVTSYQQSNATANLQYLKSGWELDDEEAETLHEIRKNTFDYMVETVRDYDLPGQVALNEEAVADFAAWRNETNVPRKIRYFESHKDVYKAFGPYWLTLAECYYQNGDYAKCIEAVSEYEKMDMRIFREDHEYARVLPFAIISARNSYDDSRYAKEARKYTELLMGNTGDGDWDLRYFAAQVYFNLYQKMRKRADLEHAYEITLNNITTLLGEQMAQNRVYTSDVVEIDTPKGTAGQDKKDIKAFNSFLKEERKKALPPVYEPLLINLQLFKAVAKEMNISREKAAEIDAILRENDAPIFLSAPIDSAYRFAAGEESTIEYEVEFDGSKLILPAELVSDQAKIRISVTHESTTTVIEDWSIKEVKRKNKQDLHSFTATYTSAQAGKQKYTAGDTVLIEIMPIASYEDIHLSRRFERVPDLVAFGVTITDKFERSDT